MGQEDPLEDETATPSSSFTWRIPWTEEPGRLHSPGVYKESVMTEHTCTHSISPSCLGLSKITLQVLKVKCRGNSSSQVQDPWAYTWSSQSFERNSVLVIILLYVYCPPWGMKLDHIVTLLLLPTLLWFLLYNFNCRRSPLFMFWTFSLTGVLILVCP